MPQVQLQEVEAETAAQVQPQGPQGRFGRKGIEWNAAGADRALCSVGGLLGEA